MNDSRKAVFTDRIASDRGTARDAAVRALKMRLETIAVHAGAEIDSTTGALAPPLHLSTTFEHGPAARPFTSFSISAKRIRRNHAWKQPSATSKAAQLLWSSHREWPQPRPSYRRSPRARTSSFPTTSISMSATWSATSCPLGVSRAPRKTFRICRCLRRRFASTQSSCGSKHHRIPS